MSEPKSPGTSRRRLLANTTHVAGSSALAGIALPHVHAAGTDTIQIALVGCGGRGTGAAVNALSVTNGPVKLVAMADVIPASCTALSPGRNVGLAGASGLPSAITGLDATPGGPSPALLNATTVNEYETVGDRPDHSIDVSVVSRGAPDAGLLVTRYRSPAGSPLALAADQVTVARPPLSLRPSETRWAWTELTWGGTPAGTIDSLDPLGSLLPASFSATTVNEYAVPFSNPSHAWENTFAPKVLVTDPPDGGATVTW